MNAVFVDTSALYALVNAADSCHLLAKQAWHDLTAQRQPLVTTNYVVVEAMALLQRRHGLAAAIAVHQDFIPLIDVLWADHQTHNLAANLLVFSNRRQLSFVDCHSFVAMRQHRLTHAFAFDDDFAEQGFTLLPTPPNLR
ncbi:MAG: PIN domain-containing protein [Bryobacter sp.]